MPPGHLSGKAYQACLTRLAGWTDGWIGLHSTIKFNVLNLRFIELNIHIMDSGKIRMITVKRTNRTGPKSCTYWLNGKWVEGHVFWSLQGLPFLARNGKELANKGTWVVSWQAGKYMRVVANGLRLEKKSMQDWTGMTSKRKKKEKPCSLGLSITWLETVWNEWWVLSRVRSEVAASKMR